jgi:hypothetical protein
MSESPLKGRFGPILIGTMKRRDLLERIGECAAIAFFLVLGLLG